MQTQTDEIIARNLPANERIQALRPVRKMLKAAIAGCTRPETIEPGGRFYPMYSGMETELAILEVEMAAAYTEMFHANA